MKKDFVDYLPYIAVTLLIVSAIVIYERGGFAGEGTVLALPPIVLPTTSSTALPIAAPTGQPTPTPVSTPTTTITPLPLGTIPSIQGRGGGEDD